MSARLAVMSGPSRGSELPLPPGELTIGREPGNGLVLKDGAVSRRHAVLVVDASSCVVRDLESRNGTFVNGVPVRERGLSDGDHLAIGGSLLVFLAGSEESAPPGSPVTFEDSLAARETLVVPEGQALGRGGAAPDRVAASRVERDLATLLDASRRLASARREGELWERLLDAAFDVLPARRGVVLAGEAGELLPAASRDRRSEGPVPISRTLVSRALERREGVVWQGIPGAPAPASLLSARSILAAPLSVGERPAGVLWLDAGEDGGAFDEDHLRLAMGLTRIAALALENVRHLEWLEGERRRLAADPEFVHDMVGDSPPMRHVYKLIARLAPVDSTVLVLGESGTGKELAARALHAASPRAPRPFLAINCASLSETLLESELFGHEKGAFTGAIARKPGKLEAASGGTVFLDEVGELPPPIQARLLRALQERVIERVGGLVPIPVDVRVVAATNRDLEGALAAGTFRKDLYYRLGVVTITMPPLRERREDIRLLAAYFASRFARRFGKRLSGVAPAALAALERYDWPGNVRELSNALERAVVLLEDDLIRPEDLPEAVLEADPAPEAPLPRYHEAVNETKKRVILAAAEEAGGRLTDAARLLGLHPNYLHRLIRNLGLRTSLKPRS